ncbi:tubulin polyglutamylase TTLL5 isoform X1 [Hippoglossus stenolepis]|uniref:tubulin polyglutamylase TTLL5 isoform X1 n=1 Tax=Hippoglossus stenolepis TaxID=195615 RepID=UPI00159C7E10|nr:tubulin polyglutamylase TTLL5 isoform X1 [Hippoglossus stenolepis]XP_047197520.1 tubulin polyglutamylase TTLL5 isoform X1 [Hippoglossus stenolepis]
MPAVIRDKEDSESSSDEDEQDDQPCIAWCGLSKTIPVLLFVPEAVVSKDGTICSVGERYNLAFKIVRTESRLVRGLLANHGFREVHPNCNDFNLMWTGSHLKPYILRSLQDFQKVNHFPRSYELTRKDRLYKNIQRMQQTHGFKNFHIVPQTFVLPSEYQEFCNCFAKDKGPWIIKPVASSRGRGIYLVSNPNQISMDENILVSRYINNTLLIDEFKFDVRLYVLVTSYDPLIIYVYEEGLARFATVKYDRTSKNIKNTFMHLTNYSVNKKSSDYVSCDDPEVEDYGNKWSMSAVLRYLRQEGKDTTLLMRQVEDLIIKAVVSAELHIANACKMFVPHKSNCFELYGFDVLIDSNLKPWLLEVNLSPSLACDAPLDLKIKASMVADMFSLVGFACQDPLTKQPRSDRVALDPSLKHPAAPRAQRQKPASASTSETEGSKDKQAAKQGQGESTLSLTAEETKVLRRIKEEYERRGGFIRIFPTAETWELYSGYLESKTSMNYMLANRLFHGRNVNGNVQLQVDAVHRCHAVQYERKLLSLETRKRRQRHLTHRSAAGKKKSGKESKASSAESSGWGGEECAREQREEVKQVLEPVSHKALVAEQRKQVAAPLERCHSEALSSSEAATHNARPRVNLLNILQQGWDLSKVQARVAFSSYLQRVQLRLLAESRTNSVPAWPDKDSDQMELVIRFLRRAASNLQQDIKVVLPSRQLPLQDRRRILSYQLGEFVYCYNKETEHMVKKQEKSKEEHCVNPSVFQEYITAASENDLEEVLTFYTQKNKSANVFLGTKVRSVKKDVREINASGDSGNCENSKTPSVAKEDSSASESSLSTGKVSSDPDIKAAESQPSVRALSEEQQAAVGASKAQPDVQASQHYSGFPVTLDCTHVHVQHCSPAPASLPLHCPPPPPPPAPQPPSYTQSLAKSQFCHPETLSVLPAYTSVPMVTKPPRVTWTAVSAGSNTVSTAQPSQELRRIQSFATSTSGSGAASSIQSATHIYSQKLSRPTSAGQVNRRSSSSKLKSNSVGALKDLNSLSAQAQSNQQAFISALQKLADKQVARHYASSSHINLLTQHLTNLNLANRMLSQESCTLNPKVRHTAAATQGPVRAAHSGTDLLSSSGHRPLKEDEGFREGQMQSAYSLVTGVKPQQRYQPTQGSYQLQFAIQQLQQQKLQSRQFLDQSQYRHQAPFPDQTGAPLTQTPAGSSSCPPASFHVWPNHSHVHGHIQTVLAPKPPSSAREGQIRKTATKRLIKQTSSESSASGTVTSGQHMVYEAICGKTGLSAYRKLLQGEEPSHR